MSEEVSYTILFGLFATAIGLGTMWQNLQMLRACRHGTMTLYLHLMSNPVLIHGQSYLLAAGPGAGMGQATRDNMDSPSLGDSLAQMLSGMLIIRIPVRAIADDSDIVADSESITVR